MTRQGKGRGAALPDLRRGTAAMLRSPRRWGWLQRLVPRLPCAAGHPAVEFRAQWTDAAGGRRDVAGGGVPPHWTSTGRPGGRHGEFPARASRHAGFVEAARAHARALASGRSGGEAEGLVAAVRADARGLWLVARHAWPLASRLSVSRGRKGALDAPPGLEEEPGSEPGTLSEARRVVRDLDLGPGQSPGAAVAALMRLGLDGLVLGTEEETLDVLQALQKGGERAAKTVADALEIQRASTQPASTSGRERLGGVYLPELFGVEDGWLVTTAEEEREAQRVDEDAAMVREGCLDPGCSTRRARTAHSSVGVCLAIDDGLEATREVDDAVGLDVVERGDGSGVFDEWVTVAIADPAEGLRKGRTAERLARAKSSSVYLAHGSYNMMPSRLSVTAYSLRTAPKGTAQDVFLIRAHLDADGGIAEATVGDGCTPGGITRMTYAQVDVVLAQQEADGTRGIWEDEERVQAFYRERLGGIHRGGPSWRTPRAFPGSEYELLARLRALTDRRRRHRFKGGATAFSFPKPRPSLRKDPRTGLYTDVVRLGNDNAGIRHSAARKLVEESMILGGSTCARWAFDRGVPIPYRSMHRAKEPGALEREDPLLEAVRRAERLGMPTPSSLRSVDGQQASFSEGLGFGEEEDRTLGGNGVNAVDIDGLQTIYVSRAERGREKLAGSLDPSLPGSDLAAQLELIRGLPNAETSVKAVPHMAVGLDLYTQATSPVRRFRDVLVHQQIKAAAQGFPTPYTLAELSEVLPRVELSIRRADLMMDNCDRYWTLRYLRDVVLKRQTRLRAVTVAIQYRNPINDPMRFAPLSSYGGGNQAYPISLDPAMANPGDTLTVFLVEAAGLSCSAKCMTHTRIGEPIYAHVSALAPEHGIVKLVQAPGGGTPDVADRGNMFQPDA